MHKAIQIIEKPGWVSWDEIRKVLWESHAENREKGIKNALPSLPSDEIRKKVGDKGKMFVALDGKKVVGTYAVLIRNNRKWFTSGDYAYLVHNIPFSIVETVCKDSFQNGSRKRTGETFWYINLNIT